MEKSQFSITLSQFIKLILLILSLQLILFNHAHADDIRFNRVKYIENYGFLGVGDNGLIVHSQNGRNWEKINLPSITPKINLLDIYEGKTGSSEFEIEAVAEDDTLSLFIFKIEAKRVLYKKNIPLFIGEKVQNSVQVGDKLWSCGYLKNERIFKCSVKNLSTNEIKKIAYPYIPKILNQKRITDDAIQLQLESPYLGSYILLARFTSSSERPIFIPIKAPSGVIFEGFAGESYAVNVLDAEHGSVQLFKAGATGAFTLKKTITAGRVISESGIVALPTMRSVSNGSINSEEDVVIAVPDVGPIEGLEIFDYISGKVDHLPIAARTCSTITKDGDIEIEVLLGLDNHALVSFEPGQWRAIPITGL